ncbi:retrovirus-related Pol polyprotein from transposon 297 [Trichonephila clavipes]|nr:retrovirus-related Pol polyprotein from transposon 297 [Trichonephila clavipes]
MNFDIIIGCNLIKQANLTITPDSVMFSKPQIEVSDASPQPFVLAITDNIPKFDIGPEIPKQTRNNVDALLVSYRPNKPIYDSPRRLPFTERDIVDKQIDEWTENGHIIENNKLFPSPFKTKSVVHYPEPKTTKEVQRFLGLTGYFRKFIPAYSVIAKPLSDLLRKDPSFNFDVKQEASFDELKRLLCQKPVLGIYQQNFETEIHTDASIYGLAAVLLQRSPDDNSLHPIYYISRKTSETEKKYTSYELEVLAIIEALKKFKVYILGMPFKIITDCNAFTKTMTVIDSFTNVVWLYPTKTTSTSEVIKNLDIQKTTFGNPRFVITDFGTTLTSDEFHIYCSEQKITLHHITTGLPCANGQVERINRTIIPVLSKMSEEDPTKWFKHVPSLQEVLNSTFQ